ncbi:MAG: outer membrane beta-barrel protein [Chitinophagales bacterium]
MYQSYFWHFINLFRQKVVLLLFVALLGLSGTASAQLNYLEYVNKKLYFGITMGVNISTYKYSPSEAFTYNDTILNIGAKRGPGFNLGIITNLKLGKHFDLRFVPALSFADKSLEFTLYNDSIVSKNIESININFPISLRLKSKPINDMRIYVLAGLKYNLDLASNAKARLAEDQIKIGRHDFSYEYGIGVQFFFPLFIFSPEIKISNGLYNVHAVNNNLIYSGVLDKLQTRTILISFHFEG